ncbi:uncharacterized protein F4807DRAFT_40365 [Annulohypoxylon truncatum]|uniref:uncharacterized protein n=1 Tax=Annulohypoxylon truncatum TaxID=327061 RepID=UPI0020077773|nr:uncharacterized protein F4807DRAFT_40365 [Annulohypoxylon truncatum]KAI1210829.1 hypothetical protein F4807DRAFT_40365 [Annulohypoxylon truncatum]
MDIKDISEEKQFLAHFDQIKQNAERAYRRKGEKVREHPPPQMLVWKFIMKLAASDIMSAGSTHKSMFATSQVPAYYLPCIHPVQELKPLMISNMTLETHHRGKRALVRVLTPADRMTAVMAIIEDEEGTAVMLQLYNQPEESVVSKDQILREGDVCILKEPYFKVTVDGSYSLRVDHVSDVIWLQDTDPRIPLKWRKRVLTLDESSKEIRLEGNAAVQKCQWAEAEKLYTDAIRAAETPEEAQLAHLNRSLANLHLERPEKALDDALRGHPSGGPNEKALFREAKALYALRKFSPCLEKFLAVVRCNPKNSDAWAEIKRVKQRLCEEETGAYQFGSMYKQAERTPPLIDCATYVGSVEVRDSPGRGKGLFTTKRVKAGELLLCEKAFAYSYAGDDTPIGQQKITILMNLNSKTMCMGGQANLITQIVQKIYHNHEGADVFTNLHHGDYPKVATSEVDEAPVVDTFLIAKIIQLNCFGAPRSSYATHTFGENTTNHNTNTNKNKQDRPSYTTCGIWPLASRINHACVTNCRRSFIGDFMLVRATRDLDAGTELLHAYHQPDPDETYEETRRATTRSWGFACGCALCLAKKETSVRTARERKALYRSLDPLLRRDNNNTTSSSSASAPQLARAAKVLGALEKTYGPTKPGAAPVPRLELWDPYFALAARLVQMDKPVDGLEMALRGLEALGYVVVASPPRDAGKKKKGVLEIKRWGQVNEYVIYTFLSMLHAYGRLAPELCEVVKGYAGIIYSIVVGEKDTIGTRFPTLAS